MKKKQITSKTLVEAQRLMDSVKPMTGMIRVVYRCDCEGCGQLFLRQFIPFSIGRGASFNQCWCQLTQNRTHLTTKVLESDDRSAQTDLSRPANQSAKDAGNEQVR